MNLSYKWPHYAMANFIIKGSSECGYITVQKNKLISKILEKLDQLSYNSRMFSVIYIYDSSVIHKYV